MKFNKLLRLLFILISGTADGQQNNLDGKIDSYISSYVQNGDFSGNVVIIRRGKTLFDRSYGRANYELGVPIQRGTRFRIASLSKTFTAAAIVLLQKQGRLNFSDRLSKYIPGFIYGDSITILHLLLHQSGIADLDYDQHAMDRLSLSETINTVSNTPPYFTPGSQSRYSNTGYLLLAAVIEKASGESYEDFLKKNIFDKLDMKSTGAEHQGEVIPGKATGYNVGTGANDIASASWFDINLETGSGSLYSTVTDLIKWLRAIKDNKLIDITGLVYPFGWGAREYFKNKKSIEQSGFLNGYASYMAIYPSEDLLIVALSNISSCFNDRSGRDLAAICFGEKYLSPGVRLNFKPAQPGIFVGKYSWPGYKDFFIEQKDNGLYWRFTDEKNGSPLAPVEENTFILRLHNNKIIFRKNDDGSVSGLSFYMDNNETFCKITGKSN